MELEIRLAIEGNLRGYLRSKAGAFEKGAMRGAREGSDRLKEALRANVIAAGLGQRLANTWRGAVYPQKGTSLEPVALVYSKAPHIKRAFEEGATIRAHDGFWLAIPTENARPVGGRRVTPGELEQRLGIALRFVPIFKSGAHGKFGLLVADQVRRRKGKRGGFAKPSASALARGDVESVVMFVLVQQVRLRKRLDIAGIAQRMRDEYPRIVMEAIESELQQLEARYE